MEKGSKKECYSCNEGYYILKENSIIAIEPGVYFPGEYGIRIEDTCLVTKEMSEPLTKSKKDILVVKLR